MKINLKNELPIFLAFIIPFIYLKYKWSSLPIKVPIHWDFNGKPDGWTDKVGLLLSISFLLFASYLFWILLQIFNKQNWVQQLGNKFYQLRFIFSVFFSIICLYIIYSASQISTDVNFVILVVGGLIAVIGNYISSLKPNYFFGIRTPWTLKNEMVWKKTHQFSSRLMLICGLFIVLLSLFQKQYTFIYFLIIVFIMVVTSIIYSYATYKQIQKQ